ncbi:PIH1 domain-containing protein 1 [Chytriomyces hyalinus]|nr:PIH1 domain-containing protein 1 [Chytriomyces hyalinus]
MATRPKPEILEAASDPDATITRLLGTSSSSLKQPANLDAAPSDDEVAEMEAFLQLMAKNPDAAQVLQQMIEKGGIPGSSYAQMPFPEDSDPDAMTAALSALSDSLAKSKLSSVPVSDMVQITPKPGLVIKTHLAKRKEDYPEGMKVFINLCHSTEIPPPPTMDYEEVSRAMLESDNVSFKVPLSLSAPKTDKDKAGKVCLVFDAACNTSPFQQAQKDGSFHAFMVTLCCEWVEAKHELVLSRDISFPKLKSKGEISIHTIRKQAKSIISELPKDNLKQSASTIATKPATPSHTLKAVKPFHEIFCEPPQGDPEFFVVRVNLPQLATIKDAITLDVEEKQLILSPVGDACAHYVGITVALTSPVDLDQVGAQFDLSTRVLTVTLVCRK